MLAVVLAGLTAACGGDDDAVEPVASRQCTPLLYEGEGEPDVIVVSDMPRRGEHAPVTTQLVDAIEFVLRKREFRAGEFRVGFQSCDYTVGGSLDSGQCVRNARASVAAESVVGVIGPFNSGCAELQIPIVSRTTAGPLAMISPANTFSGLTRDPYARRLYPDGVRSYARVVTHDQAQGAAAAHIARRLGAQSVAVLAQRGVDDQYVDALIPPFRAAARSLGLEERTFDWPVRERYTELAASVAAARPGAVYLVGLSEGNADALLAELRAELGDVPIVTPDSFAVEDIARELGPVGEGLLTTVPGIPPSALPSAGHRATGSGSGQRAPAGRERPLRRLTGVRRRGAPGDEGRERDPRLVHVRRARRHRSSTRRRLPLRGREDRRGQRRSDVAARRALSATDLGSPLRLRCSRGT